jgi:hypothetical protein
MLPRIVLFGLQLLFAWYFGEWIARGIASPLGLARDNHVWVYALVYAVIVWVVGFGGSGVLKEVRTPSAAAFVVTLALAIAFAIVSFLPQTRDVIESIAPGLRSVRNHYPLVGAMIGYLLKR